MLQFFVITLFVTLMVNSVQSAIPDFEITYETRVFKEGSIESVLCNATHDDPTITYKWYNEALNKNKSRDIFTSESPEGSRLHFNPVRKSHEGAYTCTAEDDHGLSSKIFEIIVQPGPPSFEVTFETRVFKEGSIESVLCNATHDSPITYKWYNKVSGDDYTSNRDSDIFTSESPSGSRLNFNPVRDTHEGMYTCTAENEHGLVSKVFQIVVQSDNTTSENVTLLLNVSNVTDTSVTISILNSNPDHIYEVEYFEKIKNNITSIKISGPSFVLTGLIPSGLYTVRVRAVSIDGTFRGESDGPLRVVLLPYIPEMVLRSLTANTLQVEWSAKWDDLNRETIDGYSLQYGTVQRANYDTWQPVSCLINIELPKSCYGRSYTIANLFPQSYYEIRLRARTQAGYGKPAVTKIFVADSKH